MNRYPMQRQAQQLQAQGRYGDDVLVHMNPAEVRGLASLSPTGKLTRNPQTGQPEAFLPMLIPMLASWGASSAAGAGLLGATLGGTGAISAGLGSALAGGIGSGLATAAMTGDIERGLVSGITGAGLGAGLNAAASNVADTAASSLSAVPQQSAAGVADGVSVNGILTPTATEASNFLSAVPQDQLAVQSMAPNITGQMGAQAANPSFGESLMAPFQKGSKLGSELMKPRTMYPMAVGMGQMAAWDQEDAYQKDAEARRKARGDKKAEMRMRLNRAYGYADGGIVRLAPGGSTSQPGDLTDTRDALRNLGLSDDEIDAYIRRRTVGDNLSGDDPRTPKQVQEDLQGTNVSAYVPYDYMPGFSPEFDYFQNNVKGENGQVDPSKVQVPEYAKGPYGWGSDYYHPYASPINRFMDFGPNNNPTWWPYQARSNSYFNSVIPSQQQGGGGKGGGKGGAQTGQIGSYLSALLGYGQQPQQQPQQQGQAPQMADGGPVPEMMLNTPRGPAPVAQGGIANVPNEMAQPMPQQAQPQGQPQPQELEMVAMAIAGMAGEQGQQIIDMFIQKYGPQVFQKIRQVVLQAIQPGAQTQGMVKGQGGGMDDKVPGMIGAQQPVAVSPGEYIVPADVVSGIGDGSSDAGAEELDRMSQNVRMARGGSAQQPPALDARRLLPR